MIQPIKSGSDSRRNWKTINAITAELNAQSLPRHSQNAALAALQKRPRDSRPVPWLITRAVSNPADPATDWRTIQVNPGIVNLYNLASAYYLLAGGSAAEVNSSNTATPIILDDDEPFIYIYAKIVEADGGATWWWEVNHSADLATDEPDWLQAIGTYQPHYQPPISNPFASDPAGFLLIGRVDTQTLRDQQQIQIVQYLDYNPVLPLHGFDSFMRWRGTWGAATTYLQGDVVRHSSVTYVRDDQASADGDDGGTPGVSGSWVTI